MKIIRTSILFGALVCANSVFASIQPGALPTVPFNGSDYVGTIDAVAYHAAQPGGNHAEILVMTSADKKHTANQFPGFTIKIDGDDLGLGYALASSIGEKIAVTFDDANYHIGSISVVSDKYYYDDKK